MTANANHELRKDNFTAAQIEHWWKNMGHSAQRLDQIALLRTIVSSKALGPMRTVCEIGMNAGHSATTLLEGQQTVLIGFDLFTLPYSLATRRVLSEHYPNRTHYFHGRSQEEVPRYASRRNALGFPLCDLWLVDGDHERGAILDMRAALNLSRDGAVIVADDCSSKHWRVQQAWLSLINDGFIYDAWNTTDRSKGWCVGRFRRDESRLHLLSQHHNYYRLRNVDPVSMAYWELPCDARVLTQNSLRPSCTKNSTHMDTHEVV